MKGNKRCIYIFFTLIYLATRIPFLGWDIINIDAPAWNYRATQFYAYLKTFNFAETYRSYHPGVILMWVSGFGIELFNQIYKFFHGVRAPYYDYKLFPYLNFSQKLPLVFLDLVLILIIYKLLKSLLGNFIAYVSILILIFEPFFVANTRVLHLDALMTLFMFAATLVVLEFLIEGKNYVRLILSGFFSALAVLTKIPAVSVVPFNLALLFAVPMIYRRGLSIKKFLVSSLIYLSSLSVTFFLLFPSMWIRPVWTVRKIIVDGVIKTGGGEQGQFFLGRHFGDPGVLFYVFMFIFRMSPLLLVLFFVSGFLLLYELFKGKLGFIRKNIALLVLCAFGLFYFLLMSYATKKIDRYIVPTFPYFAVLAGWGVTYLKGLCKFDAKRVAVVVSTIIVIQFLLLSFNIFPDYFLYFNPMLGGLRKSIEVFGAMDWGAGYYKVAKYLNDLNETSEYSWLASFNDQSIDPYFKGKVEQIDLVDDFRNMQYVVLPPVDEYKREILDSNFRLIRTIRYGTVNYWYIYENPKFDKEHKY